MIYQRNSGSGRLRVIDQHVDPSESIHRLLYYMIDYRFIV
jgi:hypothetical protein